jgi:hypothetical protein
MEGLPKQGKWRQRVPLFASDPPIGFSSEKRGLDGARFDEQILM